MSERIEATCEAAEHKARRNWRPLVDQMTDVQRKVHLAARGVEDDEKVWRARIFADVRGEYEHTIREEVKALGCLDPGRVVLQNGPELKALATRAQQSAKSIVNTYNYDLARAILAIGAQTPRANRYTYFARLDTWEKARAERKDQQITDVEVGWAINRAKESFHANNAILARAEVWPYPTVCPVCAEYVAGNPYSSMDELYRRCELPAHVGCPHHGRPLLDRKLTREECAGLWIGG